MSAPSFNDKVWVTGVARNCNEFLPQVLSNLDVLSEYFPNISFSLYENDSTDNTGEALEDWGKRKGNTTVLRESGVDKFYPDRVDRISYARNMALANVGPEADLIINLDLDNVLCRPFERESFASALRVLESCDAVTANGFNGYYDIYALRIPGMLEYDCWDYYYELRRQHGHSEESAAAVAIEKWKHYMPTVTEPIEVHSAFNAAAIYRKSAFEGGLQYSTRDFARHKVCEHVGLHEQMRARGKRIMFDPGFKV